MIKTSYAAIDKTKQTHRRENFRTRLSWLDFSLLFCPCPLKEMHHMVAKIPIYLSYTPMFI